MAETPALTFLMASSIEFFAGEYPIQDAAVVKPTTAPSGMALNKKARSEEGVVGHRLGRVREGPAREGVQQPAPHLCVILHHALETRRLFEGDPPLVLVLRVDKFVHNAARGLERLDIAL